MKRVVSYFRSSENRPIDAVVAFVLVGVFFIGLNFVFTGEAFGATSVTPGTSRSHATFVVR